MSVLTIELIDDKALNLIKDLEELNLVKILDNPDVKAKRAKLSQLLAGSVSKEQAELWNKELDQMRNEWERDTY